MNSGRWISRLLSLTFLTLASGTAAMAQFPTHLSGLINDYSPASVKGGPWEMHGTWTLNLRGRWYTGDFSTDMTMSDYGTTATGAVDPTQGGQTAHVHHIILVDASVKWMKNEAEIAAAGCPVFAAPTDNNYGFQITGPLRLLTGNGQPAPFDNTSPPQSRLTVLRHRREGRGRISHILEHHAFVWSPGDLAFRRPTDPRRRYLLELTNLRRALVAGEKAGGRGASFGNPWDVDGYSICS